jgi:hypothetical protein
MVTFSTGDVVNRVPPQQMYTRGVVTVTAIVPAEVQPVAP